jgi:hypothetical protein
MHRLDFSLAKVADRGVADPRIVDERVADGCVADGRVFCKQDPRKKQRLALGSLINLNRRSGGAARFRGWRRCSGNWSVGRPREIGQGASAWRCGADGALGEEGEEVELQFD